MDATAPDYFSACVKLVGYARLVVVRVGGIHQFKGSDGRNRLPPTRTTTPSYFEKQAGPHQIVKQERLTQTINLTCLAQRPR